MILFPAIDLKDRKVVRLYKGDFATVHQVAEDPLETARAFWQAGARHVHMVDLDGALAGYSVNEEVIRRIADTVSIPIEIGGGIRSKEAVERMLDLGVRRVIIGTKAAEHPEFLRDMVRTFGEEAIVAGVDAKDGMVAVEGWEKVSSLTASDLCLTMKEYGVRHIVYTDISRDGMLSGPNVEATRKLTEETGLDIIASGGVSCMEDLKCLHEAGIRGAIIGKALYENRIDLAEAVRLYEA